MTEEIQVLKARVDFLVTVADDFKSDLDELTKNCSKAFDGVLKLMNVVESLQNEIKELKAGRIQMGETFTAHLNSHTDSINSYINRIDRLENDVNRLKECK